MEEAVEAIPEYIVPWEAFRAYVSLLVPVAVPLPSCFVLIGYSLTEDYNLELSYRKPFLDIWRDERNDPDLGPLSERMGVRDRETGALMMTEEEKEAASKCNIVTYFCKYMGMSNDDRFLSRFLLL